MPKPITNVAQEVKAISSMEKPWYKRGWAILIVIPVVFVSLPFLFLFSPIIALALIWTRKNWGRSLKIGASIAVAVAVVLFFALLPSSNSTDKVDDNRISTTTTLITTETSGTLLNTIETENEAPSENATTAATNLYRVTAVVDGDTFKVLIDGTQQTIRLIGVDTPETVDPRKTIQCFGIEASEKAKALLTGKSVRLEADSTQGELDKYGRLLRYAFLEDGTFFSKLMISEGYAREYTYNSAYKYQADFKSAEFDAKTAKRGLWADDACLAAVQPAPSPAPAPASAPTPTPTPTPQQNLAPSTGHIFYTSSHYSAKLYYCDTDDGWKSLSKSYLKSFSTAAQLLTAYPVRTLHEPCK